MPTNFRPPYTLTLWIHGNPCQGNFDEADADRIGSILAETLPPQRLRTSRAAATGGSEAGASGSSQKRPRRRIALLPRASEASGQSLLGRYPVLRRKGFNPDNDNSAVEVVWQLPSTHAAFLREGQSLSDDEVVRQAATDTAAADVLSAIMEQPFFDRLRTQQQLGYLVFSGVRGAEGMRSLIAIVQSAAFSSSYLLGAVSKFVEDLRTVLEGTSEADIKRFARGLADKRLARDKRLSLELNRNWEEISAETFRWDRRELEVEALNRLDKTKVLAFYDRFVNAASPDRRVLAVCIDGSAGKTKAGPPAQEGDGGLEVPVSDLEGLRDALQLLPDRALL